MNLDDFRAQLEQLAGPEPSPTTAAREAVHRQVRRARRRTGAITATAAVLVIAIVVAGINAAQDPPVRVRTLESTTPTTPTTPTTQPGCTTLPPPVPATEVPKDVSAWASDAPVVGGGALWTVRSLLSNWMTHDSGVYRMKIAWFTRPFGIPTFAAHRLDGPGTFHGDGNQAINEQGEWVASTLEFSTAGCWAVTVSYRGATIEYQVLIGAAEHPPPGAIGTITGTLLETAGTVPGAVQAVAGTIHVDGVSDSWAGTTASDGTFIATQLTPGTYTVTGTPAGGAGMTCSAGDPVAVGAGQTINVNVTCNLP